MQTLRDTATAPAAPATSGSFLVALKAASPFIALITAIVATSGSLYMSEVLGWIPCVLCWYQRIMMYPLIIILTIGIIRRDPKLHWYVLPMSIFGGTISLYHYMLAKTNWLPPPPCAAGVSCLDTYLNLFGFITISFLALTAFLIITVMMAAYSLKFEEVEAE